MIIGNQSLINLFKELKEADLLAGSYIFLGEPQVGKFTFAKNLTESFEGNNKAVLSDALIIQSDSEIGIDEVRQIKNFLWQTPVISPYRTTLIDGAERLTPEAQNALLKIIEEPPLRALIILNSSYSEILAPTLLSRLKKICFKKVSPVQVQQWLEDDFKVKPVLAKILAGKSMGRPGLAYNLLYDKNTKELEKQTEIFIKGDIYQRYEIINKIIKDDELFNRFIEFLILELRDKFLIKNYKVIKEILARMAYLKRLNLNKKLQLEIIANQIEL